MNLLRKEGAKKESRRFRIGDPLAQAAQRFVFFTEGEAFFFQCGVAFQEGGYFV